jgi:hypothetical protein
MRHGELPLGMARLGRNYSVYSALVAGVIAVWAWLGWGFPFVMAKDYVRDKGAIDSRLEKIEAGLTQLSAGQLEQQELQLLARVQDLEREVAKAKPSDPLQVVLERQKNEAEQSLARVRRQLALMQGDRR